MVFTAPPYWFLFCPKQLYPSAPYKRHCCARDRRLDAPVFSAIALNVSPVSNRCATSNRATSRKFPDRAQSSKKRSILPVSPMTISLRTAYPYFRFAICCCYILYLCKDISIYFNMQSMDCNIKKHICVYKNGAARAAPEKTIAYLLLILSTSTAIWTVAPTIGLLPMPM
jgi:hypothetical protein